MYAHLHCISQKPWLSLLNQASMAQPLAVYICTHTWLHILTHNYSQQVCMHALLYTVSNFLMEFNLKHSWNLQVLRTSFQSISNIACIYNYRFANTHIDTTCMHVRTCVHICPYYVTAYNNCNIVHCLYTSCICTTLSIIPCIAIYMQCMCMNMA